MNDEGGGSTAPDISVGNAPNVETPSLDHVQPGGPDVPLFGPLSFAFRALASLQLAVVLIAVYVMVLAAATFVESADGAETARRVVYGTAWFAAIHVALAVNVLAAMLIRFPWRRRQIGFLITHGGILVLLLGCALTRWRGVEAQLPVLEGHANHIAWIDGEGDGDGQGHATGSKLELGFQVYLHQFQRRLDPGSGTPSHYSSRVDFLELSDPPKKDEKTLQEDVLITLNAPVDFTDPQSGRTYRLFQESFKGPWTPGDAEFDELAGSDHGRDEVYLSRLSVNYDPGRWPKYAGCLLIVLGITVVYYLRGGKRPAKEQPGSGDAEIEPLAVSQSFPTGQSLPPLLLASIVLLFTSAIARAETDELDWSAWQHLPTFADGRVTPLDTFARDAVEAICGRANPTLRGPDAPPDSPPQKFEAAELLFSWLAEPKKWAAVPFLPTDRALREYLDLPLADADGRPLCCMSPSEVATSKTVARLWAELQRRADVEGREFRPTPVEKQLDSLLDAYGKYHALTFDPHSSHNTLRRFNVRGQQAGNALYKLVGDLHSARRISGDPDTRKQMLQAGDTWQKLVGTMHGDRLSLTKVEPAVAAFAKIADQLATSLAAPDDAALTALAANLRHQAAEMFMALYDNGEALRLVPALDPGALEENRTPEDDASPWLSFQAVMYGSDELLRAYPRAELLAVRKAFADAKAAYHDRNAANRRGDFAKAMHRFNESLQTLAEKIEPLRQSLPLRHRDQTLIDVTAYPAPGSSDAEVFYNRLNPFFWSWAISLAATLCLLLAVGRWRKPLFWLGAAILLLGQAVAAAGMGFRWYITGLVPLTGMFETVEFVAIYSAILGLWFAMLPLWCGAAVLGESTRMDRVIERRLFALAGAIVGFTAAVLAYYAPATVMHRHIGSVTPILRDNFWLAIHVVTIMASYASAAIALILGNISLGYYLFGRYDATRNRPPEMCGVLAGFIYTAIQITVLLLAAGTILGGLWADKAWGHFWGWDPKEVWALISLLAYLLILHMRYIGWSRDFGMAVTAVFGCTAILFTYYGVNFVLGSGMHAYGSGAGGLWAVGSAAALQWLFLFAAAVRREIAMVKQP